MDSQEANRILLARRSELAVTIHIPFQDRSRGRVSCHKAKHYIKSEYLFVNGILVNISIIECVALPWSSTQLVCITIIVK